MEIAKLGASSNRGGHRGGLQRSRVRGEDPEAKVQTYMASGLPVVCTPSAADRMCIKHGKTGFFAHGEEEWYSVLAHLVEDGTLRERVGRAARESVLKHASIDAVGEAYCRFFKRCGIRDGSRTEEPA